MKVIYYQMNKILKKRRYSTAQLTNLFILRIFIGWHLLYEGISKLIDPNWTSKAFLRESEWILSGFAHWVISHDGVLAVVDVLNSWGLTAIGLGLIVGLFTEVACYAGAILLILYYLNSPPLIGLEYTMPSEGNYLIINKTLIESITLFILALFPNGSILGLDRFFQKYVIKRKGNN